MRIRIGGDAVSRLRMAVASHLLLRNAAGEALFLQRIGSGYADGYWSIPAGHVESGETLAATCVREAAEEIGVDIDPERLRFLCIQQKLDDDGEERIDAFFEAVLPSGQQPRILEPSRCGGLRWAQADRPPQPLVAYVAAALSHVAARSGPLAYFGYDRDPAVRPSPAGD
jgi:8-oxo-dGTP diphosphatase